MNFVIIIGIPLLIEASILCIQNILELLLKGIGILKFNRYLHTIILRLFFLSFYMLHFPITLSILAFQLPLNLLTLSQASFHLPRSHMILYKQQECY